MRAAAPPAMSEAQFQRAVSDLARRLGWRVAHFHDSRRQVKPGVHVGDRDAAGWPDLVLCRAPRLLFAELKSEKGKLRPEQSEWLRALRALEGVELVSEWSPVETFVWRPSMWTEIQRILERG